MLAGVVGQLGLRRCCRPHGPSGAQLTKAIPGIKYREVDASIVSESLNRACDANMKDEP